MDPITSNYQAFTNRSILTNYDRFVHPDSNAGTNIDNDEFKILSSSLRTQYLPIYEAIEALKDAQGNIQWDKVDSNGMVSLTRGSDGKVSLATGYGNSPYDFPLISSLHNLINSVDAFQITNISSSMPQGFFPANETSATESSLFNPTLKATDSLDDVARIVFFRRYFYARAALEQYTKTAELNGRQIYKPDTERVVIDENNFGNYIKNGSAASSLTYYRDLSEAYGKLLNDNTVNKIDNTMDIDALLSRLEEVKNNPNASFDDYARLANNTGTPLGVFQIINIYFNLYLTTDPSGNTVLSQNITPDVQLPERYFNDLRNALNEIVGLMSKHISDTINNADSPEDIAIAISNFSRLQTAKDFFDLNVLTKDGPTGKINIVWNGAPFAFTLNDELRANLLRTMNRLAQEQITAAAQDGVTPENKYNHYKTAIAYLEIDPAKNPALQQALGLYSSGEPRPLNDNTKSALITPIDNGTVSIINTQITAQDRLNQMELALRNTYNAIFGPEADATKMLEFLTTPQNTPLKYTPIDYLPLLAEVGVLPEADSTTRVTKTEAEVLTKIIESIKTPKDLQAFVAADFCRKTLANSNPELQLPAAFLDQADSIIKSNVDDAPALRDITEALRTRTLSRMPTDIRTYLERRIGSLLATAPGTALQTPSFNLPINPEAVSTEISSTDVNIELQTQYQQKTDGLVDLNLPGTTTVDENDLPIGNDLTGKNALTTFVKDPAGETMSIYDLAQSEGHEQFMNAAREVIAVLYGGTVYLIDQSTGELTPANPDNYKYDPETNSIVYYGDTPTFVDNPTNADIVGYIAQGNLQFSGIPEGQATVDPADQNIYLESALAKAGSSIVKPDGTTIALDFEDGKVSLTAEMLDALYEGGVVHLAGDNADTYKEYTAADVGITINYPDSTAAAACTITSVSTAFGMNNSRKTQPTRFDITNAAAATGNIVIDGVTVSQKPPTDVVVYATNGTYNATTQEIEGFGRVVAFISYMTTDPVTGHPKKVIVPKVEDKMDYSAIVNDFDNYTGPISEDQENAIVCYFGTYDREFFTLNPGKDYSTVLRDSGINGLQLEYIIEGNTFGKTTYISLDSDRTQEAIKIITNHNNQKPDVNAQGFDEKDLPVLIAMVQLNSLVPANTAAAELTISQLEAPELEAVKKLAQEYGVTVSEADSALTLYGLAVKIGERIEFNDDYYKRLDAARLGNIAGIEYTGSVTTGVNSIVFPESGTGIATAFLSSSNLWKFGFFNTLGLDVKVGQPINVGVDDPAANQLDFTANLQYTNRLNGIYWGAGFFTDMSFMYGENNSNYYLSPYAFIGGKNQINWTDTNRMLMPEFYWRAAVGYNSMITSGNGEINSTLAAAGNFGFENLPGYFNVDFNALGVYVVNQGPGQLTPSSESIDPAIDAMAEKLLSEYNPTLLYLAKAGITVNWGEGLAHLFNYNDANGVPRIGRFSTPLSAGITALNTGSAYQFSESAGVSLALPASGWELGLNIFSRQHLAGSSLESIDAGAAFSFEKVLSDKLNLRGAINYTYGGIAGLNPFHNFGASIGVSF